MTRAKTSFVKAGLIGLALCSSADAFAQDNLPPPIAGCLPTAEMMARLKAEGQKSIVVGDRIATIDDENNRFVNERRMNVMTMNDDGSRGYNLEANAASGEPATQYCVGGVFHSVKVRDIGNRALPAELSNLDFLNRAFAKTSTLGLMVTARYGNNVQIVWSGNSQNRTGLLYAISPDGKPTELAAMENVAYRPFALERLKSGQQVASLSPSQVTP